MDRNSQSIMSRCNELVRYWQPRNAKMKSWYRLIEMIDELKTDKMESFVGNDPRSLFNLIQHMLDVDAPVRVDNIDLLDLDEAAAAMSVSKFFHTAQEDIANRFRRSGPRQSLNRTRIGYLLATGWYSEFSIISDNGDTAFTDIWNPAEVFPMWDGDSGLSEVAHVLSVSASRANYMAATQGWNLSIRTARDARVYDYWWAEMHTEFPFHRVIWNAIVIDTTLVKFAPTRFVNWPIYVAPVGGLPDMGALSEGSLLSTQPYSAIDRSERWKEEIGQSIVATNENIYRTWNKWWSFSLQLLRDTAQPRVFERSRSGKAIVKPEDVFRRGAIFRGGPDDSVDFLQPPAMPLELRSTQLDLEAMMQRGGVNWSMFGAVQGRMTASVMSQIAASANQIMKPFHQAIVNLKEDEANDWLEDIRDRGVKPYGWKMPAALPKDAKVVAGYEIEIPGDLVQRATVARMLDPDFRLSYSYVVEKLFPDIKDRMRERAMVRTDQAELHPTNAIIALVQFYRKQAAFLRSGPVRDEESARLYDLAAEAAMAQLGGQPEPEQSGMGPQQLQPPRPGAEGMPQQARPQRAQ